MPQRLRVEKAHSLTYSLRTGGRAGVLLHAWLARPPAGLFSGSMPCLSRPRSNVQRRLHTLAGTLQPAAQAPVHHEPTPLEVGQLLLGKLGKGGFRRCDPSRTVPHSLRDTGRLVVASPSTLRVPGYLFLLDQPKRKKEEKPLHHPLAGQPTSVAALRRCLRPCCLRMWVSSRLSPSGMAFSTASKPHLSAAVLSHRRPAADKVAR